MRRLIVIAVLTVIVAGLVIGNGPSEAQKGPIKIGMLVPEHLAVLDLQAGGVPQEPGVLA